MKTRGSLTLSLPLLVLAAVLGCGTNPPPVDVLCTQFKVGDDFSKTDFGVSRELAVSYRQVAQAVADLTLASGDVDRDVTSACRDLAAELAPQPLDTTASPSLPEGTGELCALAASRVAARHDAITAAGVTFSLGPVRCAADVAYQVACEASCKRDPSCVEVAPPDRCLPADRVGVCDGSCGVCQGSSAGPNACDGTCAGVCFGSCSVDAAAPLDCTDGGCACTTRCTGSCAGTCTWVGNAAGAPCTGQCLARCRGSLAWSTCMGALAAPRCPSDVACATACRAAGAARGSCTGGEVVASVARATTDASVARQVVALERDLPPLLLVARGRGRALANEAPALLDVSTKALLDAGNLEAGAAACGVLIAATASEAGGHLKISVEAAAGVLGALGQK